jgi:hypothetical protein
VVPQEQVGGEEDTGQGGDADNRERERAVAPVLPPRDESEDRQAVQAAEDGRRRRLRVGEPIENPGRRDAQRPEQRSEPRPRRNRLEKAEATPSRVAQASTSSAACAKPT